MTKKNKADGLFNEYYASWYSPECYRYLSADLWERKMEYFLPFINLN